MRLVILALILAPFSQEEKENEAEKLFQKMEKKIKEAKTLQCKMDLNMEAGDQGGQMKGSLHLGEGSRLHLDLDGEMQGREVELELICDGEKMKAVITDAPERDPKEPPKNLRQNILTTLTRSGIFTGLFLTVRVSTEGGEEGEKDPADIFEVSAFKMGEKKKLGDHDAQSIKYALNLKDMGMEMTITLWLDAKTDLPLKREISFNAGEKKALLTETYDGLKLDEKIDDKEFQLPEK